MNPSAAHTLLSPLLTSFPHSLSSAPPHSHWFPLSPHSQDGRETDLGLTDHNSIINAFTHSSSKVWRKVALTRMNPIFSDPTSGLAPVSCGEDSEPGGGYPEASSSHSTQAGPRGSVQGLRLTGCDDIISQGRGSQVFIFHCIINRSVTFTVTVKPSALEVGVRAASTSVTRRQRTRHNRAVPTSALRCYWATPPQNVVCGAPKMK